MNNAMNIERIGTEQTNYRIGGRVVRVIHQPGTPVVARLYVNGGEDVTAQKWAGKSLKGAESWAKKMLT